MSNPPDPATPAKPRDEAAFWARGREALREFESWPKWKQLAAALRRDPPTDDED